MLFKSLSLISSNSNNQNNKIVNGTQKNQFGDNKISLLDADICAIVNATPLLYADAKVKAHI